LQERGLGGSGEDLARRFDRWRGDRGTGRRLRKLAARWAAGGGGQERARRAGFDKQGPNGRAAPPRSP
jgi:ATP-dependent helicase HrpB